ncbi:MAG: hypothetical protein JO265_15795, partial [Acidimicrobiia bacterium]|nr:hypothetical protein [Acidimicrobiia bacterium]
MGIAAVALFGSGLAAGALAQPGRAPGDSARPAEAASLGLPYRRLPTDQAAPSPATVPLARPVGGTAVRRPARPAPAGGAVPPRDPRTPDGRIAAALGRIDYPWQQLGYRIVFLGPESGLFGRTSPRELGTIEIYVRPDENVDTLAHVIAHEIGHAVDLVYGTDQRRSLWMALRGISPRAWFTCSMCQDFTTPAGD